MTERQRLIKELEDNQIYALVSVEQIADFIIEDRLRICEPLIGLKRRVIEAFGNQVWSRNVLNKEIDETLKLAGLET